MTLAVSSGQEPNMQACTCSATDCGEEAAREFARAAELAADPAQRAWLEQQSAAKVAKSPERR